MNFSMRVPVYPLATIACLSLAGFIGSGIKLPPIEISKQDSSFTVEAEALRLGSFGFDAFIVDLMWIQTLMESDLEHYEGHDRGSWLYRRFNAIATIDPHFYENYDFGGQYLMIVKDDIEGAEAILAAGLRHFPDDLSLNWNMGYLHVFERNDPKAAFPYYDRIKKHPERPLSFDALFARLSREAFGPEDAYRLAYESWAVQPEGTEVKKRLHRLLYSLKGEIDLKCLNGGQSGCSTKDFLGDAYVRDAQGKWTTRLPIVKTKIHRRGVKEE